jgi:hypothetical protein
MIRKGKAMRAIGVMAAAMLLSHSAMAAAQSVLPEGLAVHLETRDEISSKNAKAGDPVKFVVRDPVVIGGMTMIPAGSAAVGQVTRARDNGLFGRSGKLEISVSHIDVAGRQIPVRGNRDKKGASGAIGMVGAAVVFLPLGLLVRGREATIKAGTPLDVYVAKDTPMEAAASSPPSAEPATPAAPQIAETLKPVVLPPSAVAPPPEPLPPQ